MQHDDIDEHHNFSVQSVIRTESRKTRARSTVVTLKDLGEFMVVFQTHGKEILLFIVQSFTIMKTRQ